MSISISLPRYFSSRDTLRFDLPVAQRLTLGFLVTALIAGLITGAVGLQQVQSLNQQSNFYQHLLKTKTTLAVGESYLQLMNSKTHDLVNTVSDAIHSTETVADGRTAIENLSQQYWSVLTHYLQNDLLAENAEQVAFLSNSNHSSQIGRQKVLLASAIRTWENFKEAQNQVIVNLNAGDLPASYTTERVQAEPTYADAQSAIRALVQFDEVLARSVGEAVYIQEQYQWTVTIAGIVLAFFSITLVGLFISSTLVQRLKQLRQITQSVEEGNSPPLIKVIGRDEIADISSSVNAMLGIIASEQEIMTASELKDQFIASVSHELRNPLTEVFGWLDILSSYEGQLDAATQKKFIHKAMHGCQELMLLINNVLDATQIDTTTPFNQLDAVALAETVHEVIEHIDPRETNNYHLAVHVSTDLAVMADSQSLRQILRNLVSNALKYSPKQSAITISAHRIAANATDASQICIRVQDNGPGIPPAERPQLFQKFARLQRDKTSRIRGTGLGLYICKQLVESMQGQIWVESTGLPGEGSCFCFTLPETTITPLANIHEDHTYILSYSGIG